MKKELLELVRCPKCSSKLELYTKITESDEIKEGNLKCVCGERYPIIKFVPRFTRTKKYVDAWEIIWKKYVNWLFDGHRNLELQLMINQTKEEFKKISNFSEGDFKNKVVLDVGCGFGRHADLVGKWGGIVVGVDLGEAVIDSAYRYTKENINVHLVQADVYNLPFAKETFDIIYSFNVLSCTPNCELAFMKLPRLLRKNGQISISIPSVYEKPILENRFRRMVKKLPKIIRYIVFYLLVLVQYCFKIIQKMPILRKLVKVIDIFICIPRSTPWCPSIIYIIDCYEGEYSWRYTFYEVFKWFVDSGCSNIKLGQIPISMTGTKL